MAATARVVDLTDVSEGGAFKPRRKESGDYRAKFVKADDHKKEGNLPGWVMTVQIEGDNRSTYPVYLNPDKKQAWKIFQACRAAGLNVKNVRLKFDPNKLVGKAIGVFLEDDEYENRLKSTIGEMFPVAEVGGRADEDIDVDDEVEDEVEEEEEPEPTPPPRKRTARKAAPAPEPEPEEDEEDEEEEDEEEPPPPPKRTRKAAAAPAAKRTARKPAPVADDDEDEDLDLDELDD